MTNKRKLTLTGLIRSRVLEYQDRQLSGETQRMFAEELTAQGRPISYANFRTLYSRARQQLAAIEADSPIKKEETTTPVPTPKTKTEASKSKPSYSPATLDAIQQEDVNLKSLARKAKKGKK